MGREITCNPECKMKLLLSKNDNGCFFLRSSYHRKFYFKYQRNFYNARNVVLQRLNVSSDAYCSFDKHCINPDHLDENDPISTPAAQSSEKWSLFGELKRFLKERYNGLYE